MRCARALGQEAEPRGEREPRAAAAHTEVGAFDLHPGSRRPHQRVSAAAALTPSDQSIEHVA